MAMASAGLRSAWIQVGHCCQLRCRGRKDELLVGIHGADHDIVLVVIDGDETAGALGGVVSCYTLLSGRWSTLSADLAEWGARL